jgi:uncharacterized protein (DUF362 family)
MLKSLDVSAQYKIIHNLMQNDFQHANSQEFKTNKRAALAPHKVWCVRALRSDYLPCETVATPELEEGHTNEPALVALRALFHQAGLDNARYGTSEWNPLGDLMGPDDKVLLKPNWVHQENFSGHGVECLVTHSSVIAAVLQYVIKTKPRSIVVGDAPIQGCDFAALQSLCGMDEVIAKFNRKETCVTIADFRCVTLPGGKIGSHAVETNRRPDDYVLFDLGQESDLEAVTDERGQFRVTVYDPAAMQQTHAPGKHQYLIAREAIEADVVINLPKLKTHKKAGITGALKNMVGINGHKAYLPHHRKGGSATGGDCYPGASQFKSLAENILDVANGSRQSTLKTLLPRAATLALMMGRERDRNLEGSWYGNDTVWRMCLDLQRILHFGQADGQLADAPQRRVLTITDAIIAGQGNGPLSPIPLPLGLMTMGSSTAALEWVHALLLGLDPRRIPLTREAFTPHRYHLADFSPQEIGICADGNDVSQRQLSEEYSQRSQPPDGWIGHCELETRWLGDDFSLATGMESVENRR